MSSATFQEPMPRSPDQLRAFLSARMRQHGIQEKRITLHCPPDRPGEIVCLVDLRQEDAGKAAWLLDGFVFGYDTVVVIFPLPGGFSCEKAEQSEGGVSIRPCSCGPDLRR